jgi:hypothetical protein
MLALVLLVSLCTARLLRWAAKGSNAETGFASLRLCERLRFRTVRSGLDSLVSRKDAKLAKADLFAGMAHRFSSLVLKSAATLGVQRLVSTWTDSQPRPRVPTFCILTRGLVSQAASQQEVTGRSVNAGPGKWYLRAARPGTVSRQTFPIPPIRSEVSSNVDPAATHPGRSGTWAL